MTAHPPWCARSPLGCTGGHRSRPVTIERGPVLIRTGMLARLGESGSPWVELVLSTSPAHTASVELTADEARLLGRSLVSFASTTRPAR